MKPGRHDPHAPRRGREGPGARLREFLSDPVHQLELAVLLLLLLVAGGTAGYVLLEGMTTVEALYMTVITLTTVGFREVRPLSQTGMLFTIGLIVLGVGVAAYAVRNAAEVALGDTLYFSVRRRRVRDAISRATGHYIVCGYGRLGRQIIRDLEARGEQYVLVEWKPELEQPLLEAQLPHVIGDATRDTVLLEAGVERARGLVTALDSEANNVLTALTARELNPRILIVARSLSEASEGKLRRAGADRTVSPDAIGGHRLALALLRPSVHDFLSRIFSLGEEHDVDVGQVRVREGSELAGQTVAGCDLRQRWNITILGIQAADGRFRLTPDPEHTLEAGETLIVIGPSESIYLLEARYTAGPAGAGGDG